MHQTPNLPGTSPVTDNPNPNGSQGADTLGPSTGGRPGGEEGAELAASGGPNPTSSRPGPEGAGNGESSPGRRTFRCSDVGNADCRWEVTGKTEDELMPKIEQHGREAHGMREFAGEIRDKIRNAIRERRAA